MGSLLTQSLPQTQWLGPHAGQPADAPPPATTIALGLNPKKKGRKRAAEAPAEVEEERPRPGLAAAAPATRKRKERSEDDELVEEAVAACQCAAPACACEGAAADDADADAAVDRDVWTTNPNTRLLSVSVDVYDLEHRLETYVLALGDVVNRSLIVDVGKAVERFSGYRDFAFFQKLPPAGAKVVVLQALCPLRDETLADVVAQRS